MFVMYYLSLCGCILFIFNLCGGIDICGDM